MPENKGTIASLNEKGFGFIKIEGRKSNIFFHAKDLDNARFDELQEGDQVTFDRIESNEKGEAAKGVRVEY